MVLIGPKKATAYGNCCIARAWAAAAAVVRVGRVHAHVRCTPPRLAVCFPVRFSVENQYRDDLTTPT